LDDFDIRGKGWKLEIIESHKRSGARHAYYDTLSLVMVTTPLRADPGRPRNPRIDEAVLAATADLLADRGYAGVSIDAIAAKAGTTKAAIYRRWPSKAHLVHEAAFPEGEDFGFPSTGSLAGDVHLMVRGVVVVLSTPLARAAIPGLMLEFGSDPALHQRLLERLRTTVWEAMNQRLAEAISAGEVHPDVDAGVFIDALAGSAIFAIFTRPEPLDDTWIERTAELLLSGIQP
jgi:AcrR family transcriptional regulator